MSEQQKNMNADHNTLRMLTIFLDNAEASLYVTDYYTNEILLANRKAVSYTKEKDVAGMIGKPCYLVLNEGITERCSFCPYARLIDENGNPTEPYVWENYIPHLGLWMKVISQAIFWTDGRLALMVTFYDITEMKNLQEQLAFLAYNDRLLKIKNEQSLLLDIENCENKPSLIVFDIVSLQKINEVYGRHMGDLLLLSIRDWFTKQNVLDYEMYRIGGDEFCLSAPNVGIKALKAFAKILFHRFSKPWVFNDNGNTVQIYSSITMAVILDKYLLDKEPLLNLIERTLKYAKEINSILIYDDEMDQVYKNYMKIEHCLKRCIQNNLEGFAVHYQPIANPVTGQWCGLEALCRWNTPELGAVSPAVFVVEAERLRLINLIGLWVLETAVHQCKKFHLDQCPGFFLDINVSAIQFEDTELSEKVWAILNKYDYPASKLCLELTESSQFAFSKHSLGAINSLRGLGIIVALDDFGTGYSNFYQFKQLPIDIVKIEREFVTYIESDSYQQYLFHIMSELVHTAGMKLIAEGVENEKQMHILESNGADYLQGYLFSAPIPATELERQLHHFATPPFSIETTASSDKPQ